MKTILTITCLLLFSSIMFAEKLPAEWTKKFSITVHTGGGMVNRSIDIVFTYDSCKYVERTGDKKKTIAFPLSLTQRAEILKNIRAFKLDQIRQVENAGITYDKETDTVCYSTETAHCVSDGSASEVVKEDMANFTAAYSYLQKFAKQKGKL